MDRGPVLNLRGFLKQTISLERLTGVDDWGTPSFAPAVTLPARKEEKQKLVRSTDGAEVLATTRVLVVDEVVIGDRIDGRDVQARESVVDVGGRLLGWTVYL